MNVLVLGGTRFIGPAVVRELHDAGHHVVLFHRGETETDALPAVQHIHGNREGIDQYAAVFRDLALDVVIDLACMTEEDAILATAAVRGASRRTVVISSVDVYRAYGRMHGSEPGPIEPLPLTEDAPLREKLYPYRGGGNPALDAYDKILVERVYMSDPEMPGTVLRLPAVHGEGDYQRRLYVEVRRFQAERPFLVMQEDAADWVWPRAYVGNVAEAIAKAATDDRTAGRAFNAPSDPPLRYSDWLRACGRIWGWKGEVIALAAERLPDHLRVGIDFRQCMTVDDSRFRQTTGFTESVSAEEGMRLALEWEAGRAVRDPAGLQAEFDAEDAAVAGGAKS
jgi:nucleoside-diphosphate-sugar epimerase